MKKPITDFTKVLETKKDLERDLLDCQFIKDKITNEQRKKKIKFSMPLNWTDENIIKKSNIKKFKKIQKTLSH